MIKTWNLMIQKTKSWSIDFSTSKKLYWSKKWKQLVFLYRENVVIIKFFKFISLFYTMKRIEWGLITFFSNNSFDDMEYVLFEIKILCVMFSFSKTYNAYFSVSLKIIMYFLICSIKKILKKIKNILMKTGKFC